MNTLILILILWSIFKALSGRDKPGIPPEGDTEEIPQYRLPPDLRGKWGPPEEKKKPGNVVLAPPAAAPAEYKLQEKPAPKRAVKNRPLPALKDPVYAEGSGVVSLEQRLQEGEITPGMLKSGIILSEILGPPLARRSRNRYH